MRYRLPVDRIINQLTPHYLTGRKYILFLQSLVYPLFTLNGRFADFAGEKQIDARMTSQVLYFEWYLNRNFKKYFLDSAENIYIKEGEGIGVDIYHENSDGGKPFTLWRENELVFTNNASEKPRELYLRWEEKAISRVSFWVCTPSVTIPENEFAYMLSYVVNTYRLAGKTYLIKIDSKELEPNKLTR